MLANLAPIRGNLRIRCAAVVLTLLIGGLAATPVPTGAAAAAAPSCAAFTANVFERINPRTRSALLTTSRAESDGSVSRGFTSLRDTSMKVAARTGTGLVAVRRLYRPLYGGNYFYTTTAKETAAALSLGYTDQGIAFYASTVGRSCLTPVWSYFKGGVHRFVSTRADMAALSASGWKKESRRFWVGKPKVDTLFTIAVMPDTQQEVLDPRDGRFIDRSRWLVQHRSALDLRFVTHTGDVVNWDTPDHRQYAMAKTALKPLEDAGIPYSLSVGNHDTEAVCQGGGACDAHKTRTLVRDTGTFNTYLGGQGADLEGAFQNGRVDNTYHVFTAGGVGWLVLNLELWQRPGVLTWAQKVVASHPRHNVIVVTHSYLTSSGGVYRKSDYGDTAPTTLSKKLIRKYPNVRYVFSGHVGKAAHRVDRGVKGNRIDSFLLAMHSNTTNPMRFVTIDTKAKTLKTWVYAPWTNASYPRYTVKLKGIKLVR